MSWSLSFVIPMADAPDERCGKVVTEFNRIIEQQRPHSPAAQVILENIQSAAAAAATAMTAGAVIIESSGHVDSNGYGNCEFKARMIAEARKPPVEPGVDGST